METGWMGDRDWVGAAYLERLTAADLRELVRADDVSAAAADAKIQALRREPGLLLDVLDRPAVSASLLNLAWPDIGQRFTLVFPFPVFAAAIHRIAAALPVSGYPPRRTTARLPAAASAAPQPARGRG